MKRMLINATQLEEFVLPLLMGSGYTIWTSKVLGTNRKKQTFTKVK